MRWQYLDGNQSVSPLVVLGLDGGSLDNPDVSCIYALFQNEFLCSGGAVLGSQSLDTMTAPKFRGKGLFNKYASIVYERAANEGVSFVYGFPNGNSAHGFFNKLGWQKLDPVPFLVRPISVSYLIDRLPVLKRFSSFFDGLRLRSRPFDLDERYVLEENVVLDHRYEKLWDGFRKSIGVALNRNVSYMKWRLSSKPGEVYSNAAILDSEGGDLRAICFFTKKQKHGGSVGYIMDLMYGEGFVREGEALLNYVVNKLDRASCDILLAWCFDHSPSYEAYRRCGFLAFPERLRPIELHFGVRVFSKEIEPVVANRKNWYISYLDSDTV